MGQAASQNMTGYVKAEDVVAQLRSYVRASQLTATRKQMMDEIDKLYAKNDQLSNYISKQDLIKELDKYTSDNELKNATDQLNKKIDTSVLDAQKTYAKADDSKNYVLKTDKATYSEVTINDNNNYVTPLYWSERYNANKSTLQETDDNDQRFVTPRFINDRRTSWTVSSSNDSTFVNTRNDRFATPGWVTGKINKEKDSLTVSAANDIELTNNEDNKFTTPAWTTAKLSKEKNDWTINPKNDEKLSNNTDDKFPTTSWTTSKINQQKNEWTVSAANDATLEAKDDIKFPTVNWTNAKLNQLKDTSTVSVRNNRSLDNNEDTKFATPAWINSKFAQNRNNWTVSALNDPSMNSNSDERFATVAWINKKNENEKTKSTVSRQNDKDLLNVSDDKFTTPAWTNAKIAQQKAEWTNSFSKDPQLKSTNDSNFATPEWVNKKIDSYKPSDSVADASSDNKFVTTKYLTEFKTASTSAHNDSIFHFVSPKYLNDVWFPSQKADPNTDDASTTKYVTPDFVVKKISDYVKLNPIDLKTEDTEKLANRISRNANFSAEMSRQLRNDQDMQSGIADILTNINNPKFDPNNSESFSKKVSDNLLLYSNDRYLLVNQVASTLTSDDQYRAALTEDIKRKAQKIDVNLLKVGDSIVTKNSPFETKDDAEKGIINPLKLGRTDSEIELTIGTGSNDEYIDSKNTYLEVRGAAKTYTGAKLDNSRPKRRVKIYDDLLVDHKVAIGPNVDTLTDDLEKPLDKYQLKVGGSGLFTDGVDTNGSSNLGGNITVSGNTKVTGKMGIATDPDGNFDLKVGGPVNFQKSFTADDQSTFGGPATFNKNVAINDNLTVAQDKTATFGGPATFNKNVAINDNLTVAQDKTATFGGPATFNKNVAINDNLTVAQDKSATFGGPATFNKNVAINDSLTVSEDKNATFGGPATFNKNVTINDNLTVSENKTATFGGEATFYKNVEIKGTTNLVGDLNTNSVIAGGPATFNKGATINGKTDISGDTNITGKTSIVGDSNIVGNTIINGKLSVTDGGYLDNFDDFTNGNSAEFSQGWVVGIEGYWDPQIRGLAGKTGFAHNSEEYNANAAASSATYTVPEKMKTGYLMHLPWYNTGYFDIFGVRPNGTDVFIRRVNAYQNARHENRDGGYHDGVNVVSIPGVNRFAKIKIQGRIGRMHLMGIGWSRSNLGMSGETGYIHSDNLYGPFNINASNGEESGPEFRHPNRSQGIGIGYNTIYATGSNGNQDIGLKARGAGRIYLKNDTVINGRVGVPRDAKIHLSGIDDPHHYLRHSPDNNPDGPELQGHDGGKLTTRDGESLRWDNAGNVRVRGDMVATQVYTNDWFRVNGNGGLYWQNFGRGIRAPDSSGAHYGNVTTYGGGRNGWQGYDINNHVAFMSNDAHHGIHAQSRGWSIISNNDRRVSVPVELKVGEHNDGDWGGFSVRNPNGGWTHLGHKHGDKYNYIRGNTEINGNVQITEPVRISGGNTTSIQNPNGETKISRNGIQFGGPNSSRELNSAQISAGMHEANSLNIIGMSDANGGNRKVTMWAEGGLGLYGSMRVAGDLYVNRIFFKGADGRWWTFNGDNHNDGIYLNKYENANETASHWTGVSGGRIRLGGTSF